MEADILDVPIPRRRFSAVYRENLALVRATIRRLGVPTWLEDDAVQDVFVTMYRRIDDVPGEHIAGWLVVIARRVAFRHRRTALRHRRKLDALRTWMGFAPPERPWQAPEARTLLREMTRRLAPEQHQAFAWCEVEGYTAVEASERYGVNPNTVSTRLRAARHELRRALVEMPLDPAERARPRRAHALWLLWPRLALGSWWPAATAGVWAVVTAIVVVAAIAMFDGRRVSGADGTVAAIDVEDDAGGPPVHSPATFELPRVQPEAASMPAIANEAPPVSAASRAIVPRIATAQNAVPTPRLPLLGAEELAAAWRALQVGDHGQARRLLEAHERRHPESPLADSRARLRARLDGVEH